MVKAPIDIAKFSFGKEDIVENEDEVFASIKKEVLEL